ncbi:MAG: DUF1232 domain-containing protein [Chloroflexi bacterium]|nr:DUF1232 domain-containing protein [Chloroflexota bacterium]MCC6896087.1 DUF1232 domain-containing protein [Anaerolineae bacterium]
MLRAIIDQIRLTWHLIRDPRVPLWAKAIPFVGLLYVISPIDILPDFMIGLGQLDDLAIVLGGMRLFASVVPEHIVEEHRAEIAGKPLDIIQGIGHRIDSEEKAKNQP